MTINSTIAPWLKNLQRRFSPRRTLLGQESNQALDGGEGESLTCVVSRGLCLFLLVDASKAPEKERRNFVALAVRRAAPFSDPDFGVAWLPDGQGAAWYWSRSRVAELMAERSVRARRMEFVPEALFIGPPPAAGETLDRIDLLKLHEGVLGRIWKEGRLLADRWWPEVPSTQEWHHFLRGGGLVVDAPPTPPSPAPVVVAGRPWSLRNQRREALAGLSDLNRHLPQLALGLALAMATIAAVQMGNTFRSALEIWRAKESAQALDDPLKQILEAREAADRDRVSIDRLLALQPPRGTVVLLGETARLLASHGGQVKRWSQPTLQTVEATLSMPDPDPQKLVAVWEESPMFANVSTELLPRSGEIIVRADVMGDDMGMAKPVVAP